MAFVMTDDFNTLFLYEHQFVIRVLRKMLCSLRCWPVLWVKPKALVLLWPVRLM